MVDDVEIQEEAKGEPEEEAEEEIEVGE